MPKNSPTQSCVTAAQLVAATAILLWPTAGWAQTEVHAEFNATIVEKVDARSAPAKLTSADEGTLTSQGYVQIGTISASQQGKKAGPEATKLLAEAVLRKAAEAGGDVVRFSKEGELETTELPTGNTKTVKQCLRYQTVTIYSGQQCQNNCYIDIYGFQHCVQLMCSPKTTTQQQCAQWETKEVLITKKEQALVSAGTVWRHDPVLSAKIDYARGSGKFVEALKAHDLTTITAQLKEVPDLVFCKDSNGNTPLHWAAHHGDKNLAELFLSKGADVSAKGKHDWTPLHLAAANDHHDVAQLLLANKASVNARDEDGNTPLQYAINYGHTKDVVELLLANQADVNAKDNNGFTPLHDAVAEDRKDVAALLLAKGASVNTKSVDGWTPLHAAAEDGKKDLVELLLAGNAEVNAKDNMGLTPLHHAAAHDRKEVAELLLARGADLNAKSNDGLEALHIAAMEGYKDVVELLLGKGANPNDRDSLGDTPLFWAVRYGYKDVAELLLAKGANVNAKDNYGTTPLHVAAENSHQDVVELLSRQGGRDPSVALSSAVAAADLGKVQALLNDDPDLVACRDKEGQTPLHKAAWEGRKEVAELLLANKADVNAKDKDGFTPLHLAASRGHKEVAELLLAKGADVNAQDRSLGWTPLHVALTNGRKDVADLLRQRGGHE